MTPHEQVCVAPTKDNLAAALRNNEFRIHYQPQISCKSQKISGTEALMRWESSTAGKLIGPGHFIPHAENNGFIVELGDWCLQHVANTVGTWQNTALPDGFKAAINLSGRQISPALPHRVESVIKEAGVDPSMIELEITESFLFKDLQSMTEITRQLRKIGVRVAIDDFGTGFSVLEHLRHIPATTIKIDCSFTQQMLRVERDHIIMRNLIRMIRDLGMESVCEGVETTEQLEAIQDMDADHWQGFLFSPAISKDEFSSLISS